MVGGPAKKMAPGKVLRTYRMHSDVSGDYSVEIVGGAIAKVDLISITDNALTTMALAAQGYTGVYDDTLHIREGEKDTESTQVNLINDIWNTKLSTPMEMINVVFLLRDVSRAFTHQAVRYRISTAYVQESMRFLGYKGVYRVFCDIPLTKEPELSQYCQSVARSIETYVMLKDQDIPDQDARGVLPTNICTSLFWSMSLATLRHVYSTRWCCQAQKEEWIPVLMGMKERLSEIDDSLANFLEAPIDRGEDCGFHASFDRPCVWRGKSFQQIRESELS